MIPDMDGLAEMAKSAFTAMVSTGEEFFLPKFLVSAHGQITLHAYDGHFELFQVICENLLIGPIEWMSLTCDGYGVNVPLAEAEDFIDLETMQVKVPLGDLFVAGDPRIHEELTIHLATPGDFQTAAIPYVRRDRTVLWGEMRLDRDDMGRYRRIMEDTMARANAVLS